MTKKNLVRVVEDGRVEELREMIDNLFPEMGLVVFAVARGQFECAKILLEHNQNNTEERENGYTALHVACLFGYIDCVSLLLQRGAYVDAVTTTEAQHTPLILAAKNNHYQCLSVLLEYKADINKQAADTGETALIFSCQEGFTRCVSILLAHGANPNITTFDGCTPLTLAITENHFDCIDLLLQYDADLYQPNAIGTPLMVACKFGFLQITRLLLDRLSENHINTAIGSVTALFLAAMHGHYDCLEELIKHGAKTDLTTENNISPLMMACQHGHISCVALLLKHGANLSRQTTNGGITSLHIATEQAHLECVKLLLTQKHPPVVDIPRSDTGSTCLYIASQFGHYHIAKMLIEAGAEIDRCRDDQTGSTSLFVAAQQGHLDLVRLLIQNGAHVNKQRIIDGATPLLFACQNGHTACAQLLLQSGAHVNTIAFNTGATPLFIACQNGHYDIVELLIHYHADVNKSTTHVQVSPLLMACLYGHLECARLLIQFGADINQPRSDSLSTPLLCACENGREACAKLLIENGASLNQACSKGRTPLVAAVSSGHIGIVQILLNHHRDMRFQATYNAASVFNVCAVHGFFANLPWLPYADTQVLWNGMNLQKLAHSNQHYHVARLLEDEDELMLSFSMRMLRAQENNNGLLQDDYSHCDLLSSSSLKQKRRFISTTPPS